jgi:hypothetical protein
MYIQDRIVEKITKGLTDGITGIVLIDPSCMPAAGGGQGRQDRRELHGRRGPELGGVQRGSSQARGSRVFLLTLENRYIDSGWTSLTLGPCGPQVQRGRAHHAVRDLLHSRGGCASAAGAASSSSARWRRLHTARGPTIALAKFSSDGGAGNGHAGTIGAGGPQVMATWPPRARRPTAAAK